MIVTRPRGQRDFICTEDRDLPAGDQTVFFIDDLTERDRVSMMDDFEVDEDGKVITKGSGTRIYRTLKAGLKGWRNLRDENGAEIACEFDGGTITDESLSILPWAVKVEISTAIINAAIATEEDKGK